MKVSISTESLQKLSTPALIFLVPEGALDDLPPEIRALLPKAALVSFRAKLSETLVVYPSRGSIERLVLVGLGDGKGSLAKLELFRRAVGTVARGLVKQGVTDLALYLGGLLGPDYVREAAVVAMLAPYRFSRHQKKKEDADKDIRSLVLVAPGEQSVQSLKAELTRAAILADAVRIARDLVNAPSNELTPTKLAEAAQQAAKGVNGLSATILGRSALIKGKFGALLAVARGSHEEPQLITLEYQPESKVNGQRSKVPTIVLVGKGVTFDTGGINLKPSQAMGDMHMDMAGGAAVIAAVRAAALLKLPLRVIGIVPATENMPSGTALKPGDILTSRSGQTIEVLDTDAEGRLILADGLDYAGEFQPDLIVDLATLTGAALVALGEDRAAIIGNDQEAIEAVRVAGDVTGELVWPLPLDDDYRAHVKSDVADVKNLGKGRQAGVISGAAFLEKFVPKDTPWVHIDLAGPALRSEPGPYWPKGGSGWGVRLLVEFLRSQTH
ncbi:leucyl aminopeptidase [Candidatus Berkelbacteria bacterium]|nr:leucyl aminopeptidase [Candidatus Berkelbacteria bacterium]